MFCIALNYSIYLKIT